MTNTQNLRPIPFAARREHFFSQIAKEVENAVAIVPAYAEVVRNHDTHFRFRQDSSFQYLTGFVEPDAIAVFRNVRGKKDYILFVRPKDLSKEIWTGYRCGVEGAVEKFGANQAFPIDEFESHLPKLLQKAERIYYSFFRTLNKNGFEHLDQKILRLLDQYRQGLGRSGRGLPAIYDSYDIIGEMRLFKSPEELDRMRLAASISAKAHCEAMARCRSGLNEYQIEALLEYVFKNSGAENHAYPSIVASGENATILHYIENRRQMRDGDLLLIDAAAEIDFYASDITRTFPVNGKMSPVQREIYDIVLTVQKECVKMARPGATLAAIHNFAVEELTDAMIKLKFLSGDKKRLTETLEYKRYYPHGTGHLLGMDVHDIGCYQVNGEPRKLESGMAFTIEPGFYILRDDANAPAQYRGIGVRIEDDIVITSDGCEVLTGGVPKDVDAMSALIGTKPWIEV